MKGRGDGGKSSPIARPRANTKLLEVAWDQAS